MNDRPHTTRSPRRNIRVPRITWALIALALVLLFNVLFTPGFAHLEWRDGRLFGSVVDIVDRAAPVLLVSLGMTLVIATGGVDLSVGAVMAIAGALAARVVNAPGQGGSLVAVLTVALGCSALIGAMSGVLVGAARVQPIVATLVLMVAGRGVAQLLTDGQILTFDNAPLALLGNGSLLGLPVSVFVVAGAIAGVTALARGSALGLFIAAMGSNPVAGRYAGLPAGSIIVAVYTLTGVLAGLAGLVVAADIQAADANSCGLYVELDAILAVVLGGTALTGGRFSIAGTVVGALLIQSVTTTILSQGVAVELTLIVKAGIIVLVCLLQAPRFRAALRRRSGSTAA